MFETQHDSGTVEHELLDDADILRRAQEAVVQGDHGQADALVRKMLVADSGHPEALFLLAQSQASRRDLKKAVDTLALISSENRDAKMAAMGQAADWLIELRRYQEAEACLLAFVEMSPDVSLARRRLSQLLNNQGRRIEAMPHMRALARLDDVTEEELVGMTSFSDPFFYKMSIEDPLKITGSPLCLARINWYTDKQLEAREQVEVMLSRNSGSTALHAFCGRIYIQRHDDLAFKNWIENVPDGIEAEPEYWWAVGTWFQRMNQHEVAVRSFLEAVCRDDTDRNSYLGLARSLEALGQTENAIKALQRFQMLEEVSIITTEIDRSHAQLVRIVKLLDKLGRINEAVAWQKIAKKMDANWVDIVSNAGRRDIEPTSKVAKAVTCDLNASQWPLPSVSVHTANESRSRIKSSVDGNRIIMTNVSEQASLRMHYQPGPNGTDIDQLLMHQTVGGGVGALDFDLDSWPDLYFVQAGGSPFGKDSQVTNELFRNLGGRFFASVTASASAEDFGYGQGVASADLNQDGFPDLVVANIGTNTYLINNGDGTFHQGTFGAADVSLWTTSVACGDITGDHLPDIFEVNYIDDPSVLSAKCSEPGDNGLCNPQRYRPATNVVYSSAGNGEFRRWNKELIDRLPGYGFSVLIADFDDKFGNDVFIANDTDANHFWTSQEDKEHPGQYSVSESARLLGCSDGLYGNAESCMGVASGDFDRNGKIDLHVTNYSDESSDLYLKQDSGIFENKFIEYGLEQATRPMVGWGTQSADFDSNGWLDLAIVNGHLYSNLGEGRPYQMPPQLFAGGPAGFMLCDPVAGDEPFWSTPSLGRALAMLDWNQDGRTDLVAYGLDKPAALLENRTETKNWVQFKLVGTLSERDAVGAKVTVNCGSDTWTSWVTGGGFMCANESLIHVGVGDHSEIEFVKIEWPSGATDSIDHLAPNHRYLLIEEQPPFYVGADTQ